MPCIVLPILPTGPLVELIVAITQPRADALKTAGQPLPPLHRARGLLDTGSSHTCIDPTIVNALGLTPIATVQQLTPSTGANPVTKNQYDAQLLIPGQNGGHLHLPNVPVTESDLMSHGQGYDILIGRDVLSYCHLLYLGSAQSPQFVLSF